MLPAFRLALIALAVPLGGIQAAEDAPLLDRLPQSGVQSAFQILRRDYIRREDLTFEELNRAALQGLLERLDFGASLLPVRRHEVPLEAYVHAEFLAADVAYLRPETFAAGEGALFEKALAGLMEKKAVHLILDLRSPSSEGSFDESALVLECLLPQGELMFKMKQMGHNDAEFFVSQRAPLWTGDVVILLDNETCPAAEVVAACLHRAGRALLVGENTKGATVRYSEMKLDDATMLRYATAEALLPDGASYFKKGLSPHFPVRAQGEDKHKVFRSSRGKSMKPFVNDQVRPRFNEAALVAGGNPELDAYVAKSKGGRLPGDDGQLRDVVVQRALDTIRAKAVLGGATITWGPERSAAASGDEPVAGDPGTEVIPRAVPAQPSASPQ